MVGKSGNKRSQPKSSSASASPKVKWRGFVNYRPTVADKEGLTSAIDGGNDPLAQLADVIEDGYKLSVSFSESTTAFTATLYCTNARSGNAGYVLSARAAEPFDAIQRLLYIHIHVLAGDWATALEEIDPDAW